ncbi:MAG: hypothetical protein KBT36_11995 [Kurthia sp.]|nr:hypothetical protein [Candidatus Kurthia equi]
MVKLKQTRNVEKVAILALALVMIKLLFRLIPPIDDFFSVFELEVGYVFVIILAAYFLLFLIIWVDYNLSNKLKEKKASKPMI